MAFQCPHCKEWANTRTSRMLSAMSREAYYQCPNLACGHTFRVISEIVCTLVQSANPDPTLKLPFSPRKLVPPDQLPLLAPA